MRCQDETSTSPRAVRPAGAGARLAIGLLLLALAGSTEAQLAERSLVPAADIQAMIAKAAATIRPDQPVLVQPLLDFKPAGATLEYRRGAAPPATHLHNAEFFHVLAGGGMLRTGGTLVDAKPIDAANVGGSRVTGGTVRHVAAGDVLVVPPGTPHWFESVDGTLVMIAVKVPQQ